MQAALFYVALVLFFGLFYDCVDYSDYFSDCGVEMVFQAVIIDTLIELLSQPGPPMPILLTRLYEGNIVLNPPYPSLLRSRC